MATAGSCKAPRAQRRASSGPHRAAAGCRTGAVLTPPRQPAPARSLSARALDALHAADPGIALMLRVQSDEPGAFAELVNQCWSRVFGRFYRSFSDRQEAEDLAQEVFLRLYRAR